MKSASVVSFFRNVTVSWEKCRTAMRIGRRAMRIFPCADAGGSEVSQEIREETNDKKGHRCRRSHLRAAGSVERLYREAPSRRCHPGRARFGRTRLDLD